MLGYRPHEVRAMTLNDWCAVIKGVNDAHNPPLEVMSAERFEELKKRYPDKK